MNDLEQQLRVLLGEKAASAGAPMPDTRLLRRARRRQVATALIGVVAVSAIVGASIVTISALDPGDSATPTEPTQLIDTNVYGITITHPEGWYVVDPVEAGIEPASSDLPHLVLFVSDTSPLGAGTLGCPGLADGTADGFVLTLQQQPLALAGEAAREWPVELVPMELETSESSCYPGWAFRRASWTTGGRTIEARVGMGPEIAEADRLALEDAFSSLRIAPTEIGPEAFVIATGTAGGEPWELIATLDGRQLGLTLSSSGGSSGMGGFTRDPEGFEFSSESFGEGGARQVVVFGVAPDPTMRVEVVSAVGAARSGRVVDVPDPMAGPLNAFVVVYHPDRVDPAATLNAYDADGRLVATAAIAPSPGEGTVPVAPSPGSE
jgi:uncharacterized membrane protein YgcG